MYEQLGHTAVPVARVLWWEDDPAWAARPFYVREHVEGSWDISHYRDPDPRYDELRIEVSKEHARNLALVHQVDWRAEDSTRSCRCRRTQPTRPVTSSTISRRS